MTTRHFSSPIVGALALAFVVAPTFSSRAQTPAPDASSSNAAPAPSAAPAATPAPAAPTEAPVAPTAAAERPATYTMVAGDSLDSVAKKFDTSIRALAKLNKIPKEKYRKLRAGTILQIPPAKSDATTK